MNQKEIVSIAGELANRNGLAALSMKELAKECKIKPPSLYKHIDGIEHLHDLLGMQFIEMLIDSILEVTSGVSGKTAILELAHSFRKLALENPGLYQSMQLTHLQRSPEYGKKAEKLILILVKIFSSLNISENETIHLIRIFRATLHGFIDLEINQGFGLPEDIEISFHMAVELFLESLNKHNLKKIKRKTKGDTK